MKNYLILLTLILVLFYVNLTSKPEKPNVLGSYTKCDEIEIRYKPAGSNKIESKVKTATNYYDEKGYIIKTDNYEEDKIIFTGVIKNKYNEKNQLIETEFYNKDKLIQKNTYEYDQKSNKIASHNFNEKNVEIQSVKYNYDKNDFLTKEIFYNRENNKDVFTNSNTFINDKFGNRIEEINEQPSGSKSKVTYKYKYDKNNNITREERISFDNFKFVREYRYDEFGNIIETHYFDDNVKLVMIRKMEYSK